jgi:hypothetical protein
MEKNLEENKIVYLMSVEIGTLNKHSLIVLLLNFLPKQLVYTPATSVPAESLFSISSYLARKERTRLSAKNLAATVFLKVSFKITKFTV